MVERLMRQVSQNNESPCVFPAGSPTRITGSPLVSAQCRCVIHHNVNMADAE